LHIPKIHRSIGQALLCKLEEYWSPKPQDTSDLLLPDGTVPNDSEKQHSPTVTEEQ